MTLQTCWGIRGRNDIPIVLRNPKPPELVRRILWTLSGTRSAGWDVSWKISSKQKGILLILSGDKAILVVPRRDWHIVAADVLPLLLRYVESPSIVEVADQESGSGEGDILSGVQDDLAIIVLAEDGSVSDLTRRRNQSRSDISPGQRVDVEHPDVVLSLKRSVDSKGYVQVWTVTDDADPGSGRWTSERCVIDPILIFYIIAVELVCRCVSIRVDTGKLRLPAEVVLDVEVKTTPPNMQANTFPFSSSTLAI